ncbi:PH domain-containing protein [Nonomuraea sp. NPDC047897]|uniref:PH domain-containing protein n=1 Tax=Nonomuraea sp. NPDC047897 TaxID=3364346 RepID=UPI00371B9EBB
MAIPDHHLTEGERRVRSFHPHWRTLAGPFAALVLIAAASGAGLWLVPGSFEYAGYARIAICAVALALLTVWSFAPYLRWKNTGYVLTTHRLTISSGVLNKATDEIPMARITTVGSGQTLIERLLGSGTLTVESAGERGPLVLRDIPRVQEVRGELFRLLEDASDGEPDTDAARR